MEINAATQVILDARAARIVELDAIKAEQLARAREMFAKATPEQIEKARTFRFTRNGDTRAILDYVVALADGEIN